MNVDVAVAGAGGGGAVLGLALAQMGVSVLVVERQPGPLTVLRGETIQPNGQQILERLSLLSALTPEVVEPVQRFHFIRIGGERLCTMDYGMLPEPYNRALVALNAVHHVLLSRLSAQPSAQLWYGAEFQGILRKNGRVDGVVIRRAGGQSSAEVQASLVVGADGTGSLDCSPALRTTTPSTRESSRALKFRPAWWWEPTGQDRWCGARWGFRLRSIAIGTAI